MGKVTLRWVESQLMVGTDSNGNSIVIGRDPDNGSEFIGMKASELLVLAAASCSAYDVVEILTKQREPMEGFKVVCESEQMKEPPFSFTNIQMHYQVKGDVDPKKLEKAIGLSREKYCSVINSLRPEMKVTTSSEIVD